MNEDPEFRFILTDKTIEEFDKELEGETPYTRTDIKVNLPESKKGQS